jgi:hypothetical protein
MPAYTVDRNAELQMLSNSGIESLIAQIEAESQRRQLSKSDIVRERLTSAKASQRSRSAILDSIADIIGSVDQLPRDLSSKKKRYLGATGYGEKRHR